MIPRIKKLSLKAMLRTGRSETSKNPIKGTKNSETYRFHDCTVQNVLQQAALLLFFCSFAVA